MTRTSFLARVTQVAVAVSTVGMVCTTASAQTIATFTGATSDQWTTASNWSPTGVLTGTGAWAQIASSGTILRIFYPSTSFPTPPAPAVQIGAISLLPSLASPTGTFNVQNNSTGTSGTMRFYGVNSTVDGVSKRFILINSSTMNTVQFTQANAGQVFELFSDGAVHVAAGTQLTLTPLIRNGTTTGQAITKTGAGVLSFSGTGNSSTGNTSDQSTYSGGFALEGGVVQWAASGSSTANPFGIGPLTLRSGTLRSTNTVGKSINSSVILDGMVTLGSTVTGFTGNITVNSSGGALATTVASDSIVTIVEGGSTSWNQSTSGIGGITKAGGGLLRFTGLSTLTHTGSTVVQAGTLIMAGNLSSASAVSVLSGASLFGTGTIAGATSILSGGTFSPGAVGGATGLFTFGSGGLTLGGQAIMEISGTNRGIDHDAVNLGGSLIYGGGLSLAITGTYGDNTALKLFDFSGAASGNFSSITASGAYGSLTLTNDGLGVWTSGPTSVPGQTLTFTQSTGVLAFVPEPSAIVLGVLGVAAMAVRARRGSRRSGVRVA